MNNRSNAHRASHSYSRPDRSDRSDRLRRDGCIALVDAAYLQWACQQSAPSDRLDLGGLRRFLSQVGRDRAGGGDIRRIYWYAPKATLLPDHVVLRSVAAQEVDHGQSLVRAIAADLKTLAQRRACEQLLVLCDDDRLTEAIDEAQLHGLEVSVAVAEVAGDGQALIDDDPDLARLLLQADRRIMLTPALLRSLTGGEGALGESEGRTGPSLSSADMDAWMREHITGWWTQQPAERQTEISASLHDGQSIPQDLDRELLSGLRDSLGRSLEPEEKRVMRRVVREVGAGAQ